ncbi:hypothetical protein, partial [Ligaoa zhengdingensis]|uniref:hypothetical protein n=1 Tax=Ligaoa zhengdingensis TaxID=2763658 RepID=UPI0031BB49A3
GVNSQYIYRVREQSRRLTIRPMVRIGEKGMGGLKAAERPRRGFMSGGSSTQRGVRPTVTGKLALIRKLFVSGGIARRQRYALKMGI